MDQSAFQRPMPTDLEAERATLGSMLHGKTAVALVRGALPHGAAEFSREPHRVVFEVLCDLAERGDDMIDGVLIQSELERKGLWEKVGKFNLLADLLGSVPSALRAAHYANLVHDKYLVRCLIVVCHNLIIQAQEGQRTVDEMMTSAERDILKLAEQRVTNEPCPLGPAIQEAFEAIERGAPLGLQTQYPKLNEISDGLVPSELVLIGARPSIGKTALLLNIAEHLSVVAGYKVLIFSLEMQRRVLAGRLLSSRSDVPGRARTRGNLTDPQSYRLEEARQTLHRASGRIIIDDSSELTIQELRARARVQHDRHTLTAIFVDYLQLVRPGAKFERRDLEVGSVCAGLKALAKDLNLPVVAAVQLNRKAEDRTRPKLSDLRESGELEQHTDQAWLLHREFGTDTADLIVAKNRNGPTGICELWFRSGATRFDPMEKSS